MTARATITAVATELGFEPVRFADVGPTPDHERYAAWLAAGHHGDMSYLARNTEVRADPRERFAGARSAVVLALRHHHARPARPSGRVGRVARYAWGRDYHNLMGKRLKKLSRRLRDEGIASWGGVDTAPIIERAWAQAAGLGFTGKNSVHFLPGITSYLFLAVVFVDAHCTPDAPLPRDHCGTCTRCLVACPTSAFVGPRQLDARRCIAYWTIETRKMPPQSLLPGFGDWFFGCDRCQEVCPHNNNPPDADEDDLLPRNAWVDLDEIIATPDEALMERFLGTPLRRPGAIGLKRNACIVLGNSGDPGAVPSLETALLHPSEVVRAAATWALGRL